MEEPQTEVGRILSADLADMFAESCLRRGKSFIRVGNHVVEIKAYQLTVGNQSIESGKDDEWPKTS